MYIPYVLFGLNLDSSFSPLREPNFFSTNAKFSSIFCPYLDFLEPPTVSFFAALPDAFSFVPLVPLLWPGPLRLCSQPLSSVTRFSFWLDLVVDIFPPL
jgi:hypothetical protein